MNFEVVYSVPILAVCLVLAGCGTASDTTKTSDDEHVSRESAAAMSVSRENAEDVKYPVIARCAQEHMSLDWQGDELFRDYVVSVDYSVLPFAVEIAPTRDVDVKDFEFCVLEAIRTGGLPMEIPSLLATGFRVYRDDGTRSTIPRVQGGITAEQFREAFRPGISAGGPNPHKRLNGCMASHVRGRISGALIVGGTIENGEFREVEIVGSTLDLPAAEGCMVRALGKARIDLDGGPYTFRYPMAFRSL